VEQPCLIWGEGAVQLSYLLKCRSFLGPTRPAPATGDPEIAAALARGDDVVVRIRADASMPESMSDWRRVELPRNERYVAYLPPS
jgi:hypothetical protein